METRSATRLSNIEALTVAVCETFTPPPGRTFSAQPSGSDDVITAQVSSNLPQPAVVDRRARSMPKHLDSDAMWQQQDLGPLPLPALSDTLERYLSSVKPLLTETEYKHTEALCADFQSEGGVGEELQAFLEEKAANEKNWMEEWWEQLAYLRTRT